MASEQQSTPSHDAVIIGAGVSGMYQLHRFRELGLSTLVLEAGTEVGGTWYWNRYPGARFDSESYSYGYSWSEELLQEWDWQERFSAQPENLRYLQYVADKFDLRRDIRFETTVTSARYDAENSRWRICCDSADGTGFEVEARYLVTAIGPLSVPIYPTIEGRDRFEGRSWHTSHWPRNDDGSTEAVDFDGLRVAVIGTGATAVQLIPEVAKGIGDDGGLTIFQRTANWCAPLHNGPIPPEEMADIKTRYREIFDTCDGTFAGFLHVPDRRKALEISAEEREELWEELWGQPGFGIWMANFRDVLVDSEANALLSAWVADKIRERLDDPAVADKLIPTNHGFGTRRVPMETNYYEVYNQPNVELVSIPDTPIVEITASGIRTEQPDGSHRDHEFDILIYATGFDAVLGGFNRLDIQGTDGQTLAEAWPAVPAPTSDCRSAASPTCSPGRPQQRLDVLQHAPLHRAERRLGERVRFVPRAGGHHQGRADRGGHGRLEGARGDHRRPDAVHQGQLVVHGINSNLEGRDERQFLLYAAGLPTYRDLADEVAAKGYEGFVFS